MYIYGVFLLIVGILWILCTCLGICSRRRQRNSQQQQEIRRISQRQRQESTSPYVIMGAGLFNNILNLFKNVY